jgi:Relaxase/Mobilisation nuclease domain/Large polyvalent protein-associated domain 7
MIAKVQPSKQKSRSSFKRLLNYLTKEVDPETGETLLRGEAVLSNNLVGIDTAAAEMKAVESLNLRCDDAVCHYELAWPPGERPTRAQWMEAAEYTLDQLGYKDHQYVVVAHDDKKHFHIHIMLNKVHPETHKAHTPYRNWITLDAAVRTLEAKYGWSHTVGPTRWDAATQKAVRTSKSERNESRSNQDQAIGAAAKYEHYHDEESLQTYVRREVAPRVQTLLTRQNASWDTLHTLLAKYHLRIEKGEAGGYTVLAIDHTIRVKASDVFRHNFAGKENRKATEQLLGSWKEPSTSLQLSPTHMGRTAVRNQTLRDERKEQRLQDRKALLFEYNQYRNQHRAVCKGITAKGRVDRQRAFNGLKQRKKEIRALAQPWPAKKILLSEAVAASVIELRTLKLSTQKTRQAKFPKNLRTWVAERAAEGDARAAAQLRGWRYADQRNQRRLESSLEANALHLGPATDEEKTDWSEFMEQRLTAQQKAENLAGQIASVRIWTINRTTGEVSYMVNGKLSVIDRGRRVTVLNQNEAAIVFGLEMAVQKYGSRIACSGGEDWKRQVVKASVQNGVFVEFTDPEMRDALRQHKLVANPLQIKAARLHALEARLQNESTSEIIFTNEADVHLLLSCLQPAAHSQQLLQILKASQEPEPKANVGGNLTVAVNKNLDGRQSFRVSIGEGKRDHIIERVEQVRQSAHWALSDRIKTPRHEREGR